MGMMRLTPSIIKQARNSSYYLVHTAPTSKGSVFSANQYEPTFSLGKSIQSQSRNITILPSFLHSSLLAKCNTRQVKEDLTTAIDLVRKYDPTGYLPGMLLPKQPVDARLAYFAVRAFWVETGFRDFKGKAVDGQYKRKMPTTPEEALLWWRQGIASLYSKDSISEYLDHPTIRLLSFVLQQANKDDLTKQKLSQNLFNEILNHREQDLQLRQYQTLDELIHHSNQSCGSLLKLVLECTLLFPDTNPIAYQVADDVGIAHGLTNALRTSIPVVSRTGKLIIPLELCERYGVKTPRFLLTALSQGDESCKQALGFAVRDIAQSAREHLIKARSLREQVLAESGGQRATAVFLPGIGAETFLDRLKNKNYDLTDLNLRNVSLLEHATCAARMLSAQRNNNY